MKFSLNIFCLFLILFLIEQPFVNAGNSNDLHSIQTANQNIHDLFTKDIDTTLNVKVVFFHGSDFIPDPDYKERLSRTLQDVSNFYKEQFKRYGLEIEGIPFEKNGDAIKIHTVKGNSPALMYNTNDQKTILNEIYNKVSNKFDLQKNYTLVLMPCVTNVWTVPMYSTPLILAKVLKKVAFAW